MNSLCLQQRSTLDARTNEGSVLFSVCWQCPVLELNFKKRHFPTVWLFSSGAFPRAIGMNNSLFDTGPIRRVTFWGWSRGPKFAQGWLLDVKDSRNGLHRSFLYS